jgi:hypothetical protein
MSTVATAGRPHCLHPATCGARSQRHCRHCANQARLGTLEQRAEQSAKSRAAYFARAARQVSPSPSDVIAFGPAVEVPKWCPPDLHDTYRAEARKHGEEHAASVCRRKKRETAEGVQ